MAPLRRAVALTVLSLAALATSAAYAASPGLATHHAVVTVAGPELGGMGCCGQGQ